MTSTYQEPRDQSWRWRGDRDHIWRGEYVLPSGHRITTALDWVLADHVRLEKAKEEGS